MCERRRTTVRLNPDTPSALEMDDDPKRHTQSPKPAESIFRRRTLKVRACAKDPSDPAAPERPRTHPTSGRWWRPIDRCRCCWRAGRRSPSRRGRSASCETPGWGCAACRKRSWSSRPRDGAGSQNHSPYWCCTPASSPCCSPEGSRRRKKRRRTKRMVSTFFSAWPSRILNHSTPLRQSLHNTWFILLSVCLILCISFIHFISLVFV